MAKPDPFDPKFLGSVTRSSGLIALISGVAFFTITELLPIPRTARLIIGPFALMTLVGAGAVFLFHLAALVSVKLEGHNRRRFQVAVSLAVPIAFAFILSARVDALPLETLSQVLTPWLLVPLGFLAWIGWSTGKHLDRNHPFGGFLITAAALFVLCWMWNSGMTTSESDPDGEGGGLFLDPERAKRARETGEFVYKYVLFVLTAYVGLFLGFLKREEAFRKLNEALTPAVDDIVSKMGSYIADRHARPGREADLPFPKTIIEMAFLTVIRDCHDPARCDVLKSVYITLDDYMLTDEDCAIVNAYRDFLQHGGASIDRDSPDSFRTFAEKLQSPQMQKAVEIEDRLTDAMRRRSESINKFLRKAE